jgi:hypothetical protein
VPALIVFLRRIKAKLGASPGEHAQAPANRQEKQIESVVSRQFATLSTSRIKLAQTREEIVANGRVPEAPFAYFLGHYNHLRTSSDAADKDALKLLKKEHPFFCDFSQMAIDYLDKCDQLPDTIAPLLRRHFFRFISIFRSGGAAQIFDYKRNLPRIGLCYFPNPGPKQFLIDALSGMADIDDMEPGKMVETVWRLNQYDFDYGAYQKALKQRAEEEIDKLPQDYVSRFPSREWLVTEISASIQYQWALVELLKRKHWDLIFLGASETPLALAFYDLERSELPPIVSLCHGIPTGDPLMSFFARIDNALVRCENEREFYADLGVPPQNMTFVGSTSSEGFPSQSAVQQARINARATLGLDETDSVILYATTYDINIYETKSCQEIMAMLLSVFELAVEKHGLKNPVLYVKYHPSPSSDPTFSFSRNQYPFTAFGKLEALGYRVRLTDSLETVLPGCDCFIAHESTTLSEALDCGIPTISIKIHTGIGSPFLGKRTYSETDCHKLFTVYDSPEDIAPCLQNLCTMDKAKVYKQSQSLWKALFVSGRSQGLMKVAELSSRLIAHHKGVTTKA